MLIYGGVRKFLAPDGQGGGSNEVVPSGEDEVEKKLADAEAKAAEAKAAEAKAKENAAKAREGSETSVAGGKHITIPQSKMKSIKEDAARRAQESLAKELGFSSVAEMRAKSVSRKPEQASAQAQAQSQPAPKENKRELQLQRERDELAKQVAKTAKEARLAQKRLDATRVEIEMREKLLNAGVRPNRVKVALHMIGDHVNAMTEEQLKGFKEEELFESWKKTDSFLFGENVQLANTGTGTVRPPAQKPGEASRSAVDAGKIDCSKMTREEFEAYKAARGITG